MAALPPLIAERHPLFLWAAAGENAKLAHGLASLPGEEVAAQIEHPDSDGRSLLHVAISGGIQPSILSSIHDLGCSVDAADAAGWTPLHSAVAAGYEAGVAWLLDHDAHVDARTPEGRTPLAYVKSSVPVAHLLLEAGADVNSRDATGWTPLHRAAARNALGLTAALIDAAASLTAENVEGNTPAHVAAEMDSVDALLALAEAGAALSAQNKAGKSVLGLCSSATKSAFAAAAKASERG